MGLIGSDEVVELRVPDEGTAAATFLATVEADDPDLELDEPWPWPDTWPVVSG